VAPVINTTTTKVVVGENEELLPVYYSQLYVHKKSTYNTLQELQGCIFAYNDDASLSGYHCLRFLLKQHYATSTTTKTNNNNNDEIEEEEEGQKEKMNDNITIPFFSRAICTGGHLLSIKAIALGDADVACIDCVVVQELLAKAAAAAAVSADDNDDPTTTTCQHSSLWYFNQLRPLHAPPQFVYTKENTRHEKSSSLSVQEEEDEQPPLSLHNDDDGRIGPNPAQPIVISKNINIDLRYRIQKAYLSLHKYVSLSSINATHFVSVTSQHYESIDSMMKECEGLDIICPNEGSMMEVEDDVVADNK
jgi:ABC-type phosphate/phosphonate transport system substrate-binding protein